MHNLLDALQAIRFSLDNFLHQIPVPGNFKTFSRFHRLRSSGHYLLMLFIFSFSGGVSAFTDNGDGTVSDVKTGLIWMRCSMGQNWDGTTCAGSENTYSLDQAQVLQTNFAGKSDWRLPNVRELLSIVDRSTGSPAIDSKIFPNTFSPNFWSSTIDASHPNNAWTVDFIDGDAYDNAWGNKYSARLVRGGQSSSLLSASRNDSDFLDNNDGTVTHKPSGLIWKKCSEGQTGGDCSSGYPIPYTWSQAQLLNSSFAGYSDWRVPTEEELISLIDFTKENPASNSSVFPKTPNDYFWSSSADADHGNYAWSVYLASGTVYSTSGSSRFYVRLVRGRQTPISLMSPGAATDIFATSGDSSALVSFTAPQYNGGVEISGYTVTSNPDNITASGSGSPLVVTGLTNGSSYTFSVVASNNIGLEVYSATSNVVTPGRDLNFVAGWNLLGNGVTASIDVLSMLGESDKVNTVWKWNAASSKWAFYSPSLVGQALTDYATAKGYEVLRTINGGEGFWVNAKKSFTAQLSSGTSLASSYFAAGSNSLSPGWNLIAVGDSLTPRLFANAIATVQPVSPAVVSVSLTSLWTWDSGLSTWYFYAPALDNSQGLSNYISSKGYLDFISRNKTLAPTTGFWVNKP